MFYFSHCRYSINFFKTTIKIEKRKRRGKSRASNQILYVIKVIYVFSYQVEEKCAPMVRIFLEKHNTKCNFQLRIHHKKENMIKKKKISSYELR